MKAGDIVMFIDEGRYAKWFYGQLGEIERDATRGQDGRMHVSVKWFRPIKYFDRTTSTSHFSTDMFRMICRANPNA